MASGLLNVGRTLGWSRAGLVGTIFDRGRIQNIVSGGSGSGGSPNVSVGQSTIDSGADLFAKSVISQVGKDVGLKITDAVLGKIIGRATPPIQVPVPSTPAAQSPTVIEETQRTNPVLVNPPAQTSPKTHGAINMSLDLGNILTTLGGAYINARYTQPTQTVQPLSTRPLQTTPAFSFTDSLTDIVGDLVAPSVQAPAGSSGKYCVDPATGKVTKMNKRRRRRRLATASDIRDLSSLKAVLSPADLKMWIATHPS